MDHFVVTNIAIYKAIADEAYEEMFHLLTVGKRPMPNNEKWIINYEPNHTSFKKALVSIIFTGMWLESLMHILIVKEFGETKFKEYDFKSYEEKLRLLGICDECLIKRVSRFRKTRKELVHEKVFFDDGAITTAQSESENANILRHEIQDLLEYKLS